METPPKYRVEAHFGGIRRKRKPLYRPNRKLYWHQRQMGCVAMASDGFTLIIGGRTVTRDGSYNPTDVIRELEEFQVVRLILADDETQEAFQQMKRVYTKFLPNLELIRSTPMNVPLLCVDCKEQTCHRFRAACSLTWTCGVPLDPAPHIKVPVKENEVLGFRTKKPKMKDPAPHIKVPVKENEVLGPRTKKPKMKDPAPHIKVPVKENEVLGLKTKKPKN